MSGTRGPEHDWDRGFDAGYEEGYAVAMAQIMAGEAHTLKWDGSVLDEKHHTCESCGALFPESEYGFSLHDELWAEVAPRPDADYFGSGVLCLDCIEKGLGREVCGDDVAILAMYGERPTFRAAALALGPYLSFGEHLVPEAVIR